MLKARLPWQFHPSCQSLPHAKLVAEEFPILPLLALSHAGCTGHEKGKEVTAVLEIYMIPGLDLLEINLFC